MKFRLLNVLFLKQGFLLLLFFCFLFFFSIFIASGVRSNQPSVTCTTDSTSDKLAHCPRYRRQLEFLWNDKWKHVLGSWLHCCLSTQIPPKYCMSKRRQSKLVFNKEKVGRVLCCIPFRQIRQQYFISCIGQPITIQNRPLDITAVPLHPPICSPVRLREWAVYSISCLWHALHVGYSDRTATYTLVAHSPYHSVKRRRHFLLVLLRWKL